MNFITFPVGSTNIFPLVNSKKGGQLVTEFNLISRDGVATSSKIDYHIGPSFVHSEDDFEIRVYQDSTGTIISPYTLEILPGRAVINGHYIENFSPMLIDMMQANVDLKAQSRAALKGELAVGLRIFYSTEPTMAGSMLVADENDEMYIGIQVVILPKDELITPEDSPTDRSKITAHLKLGTFTFLNNSITAVRSILEDKLRYIPAERVKNADKLLTGNYITKTGLNPKKLYVFAGKGTDPSTGYDTWCDTTDSLIVWDKSPERSTDKPALSEATFGRTAGSEIALYMPHKQVDGMQDAQGNIEYYKPKVITMPVANFGEGTTGTVDKAYTQHIKDISNKLSDFYQLSKGKQVGFFETRISGEALPPINPDWNIGDYILISQDYTADEASDAVRPPVTMYAVLPGQVREIKFLKKVENSVEIPVELTGLELSQIILSEERRDEKPSESDDPTTYPKFFTEDDGTKGIPNKDYFTVRYNNSDNTYEMYYYVVSKSSPNTWSNYLPVTGPVPFAQENVLGGFYNVSTDAKDAGYVYRDDYGRLRLVDYALLRSGTLAYQLAEDYTTPAGVTTEEVQAYLDEYVNNRIAFPADSANPDTIPVINVNITLSEEESPTVLNIHQIDSRFNTAVYLHISGDATSTTTINIYDCQKIRIDSNIGGSPIINVIRTELYYDSNVMNYIRTCDPNRNIGVTGLSEMKLWYNRFTEEDPNLIVDDMTVTQSDGAIISNEVDYWSTSVLNDNHYMYALKSITFSSVGDIIGCSLLMSDQSTNNIISGHKIVTGNFELPQGLGLTYPITCLTKQLKITGTFVSAYESDEKWLVTDVSFSALTSVYDEYEMNKTIQGTIAIHSVTNILEVENTISIPAWEPDSYHIFYGGATN